MVNYVNEDEHLKVIKDVLSYLFKSDYSGNLVLKGGTALLLYYGLTRFSEDIDLDANKVNIGNKLKSYVRDRGYSLSVTKDTPTVKRYMIHYAKKASLKVEVSYRGFINQDNVNSIDGVNVYSPIALFENKINAILSPSRNKIRDLYDITYMYFDLKVSLTDSVKSKLYDLFSYDNLDYLLYVIDNHDDVIIPDTDLEKIRLDIYSIFDDLFPDDGNYTDEGEGIISSNPLE